MGECERALQLFTGKTAGMSHIITVPPITLLKR